MSYNYAEIEKKWQEYWDKNKTFKTDVWDFSKPKYYALDMFPYPSGQGLHVGHPEGYTATDIMSRMRRMQGYNVLHPMGWDAFGLPAEQYAIKTGNHPAGFTERNIATFKRQLKMLGFSFDWDREISTCDPSFYKWTQWIFKQLYNDGLAKLVEMPVNWCDGLGCVLSNDEVINGKSERGGYPVVRKNMKQWVMDIPKYAEILLNGLDEIDWPESTKEIQRNWIGKSVGAEVKFKVANTDKEFTVFTTRADTLFGATYCVLSPEHELVDEITTSECKKAIEEYKAMASAKSDLERTELNKEKTGCFTGAYAINPVNGKQIPIWISDYVLSTYGTGAIMAVPAHDERDFEFATKFGIEIIPVLEQETGIVRENESFKNSIVAVIYNPKTDKYLTINWGNKGGRLFIGGTKNENESDIDCAIREIQEETGYTQIKFIRNTFPIKHHYFAYNKNKAYAINAIGLLFELEDESKVDTKLDKDEENNFTTEWVSKEQISEVTDELHSTVFKNLLCPQAFVGDGIHINSDFLNGLGKQEAIDKMIDWLEEKGIGTKKVNYKIREWIFARQRYWGEPIPVVFTENNEIHVLADEDLPLVLPELEDYAPSKTGASPLDKATDWVNTTFDGKPARRETSTMPGSAGSSWYFLRYIDPHNENEIADPKLLKHWMPVDLYVGGPEHAVGHLLYSRFWNNYLYNKGIAPTKEPFAKLRHQGMILGSNGEKMSKSKGNVINPDDMVKEYGADALRVYEMFMGPIDSAKPWDPNGIDGSKKFLDRVWRLFVESGKVQDVSANGLSNDSANNSNAENGGNSINKNAYKNLEKVYNYTVKKVTNDYENMYFNTAISQMMIFINSASKEDVIPKEYAEGFIKLLNPVAPHITEEIWNRFGHNNTITYEAWPTYDETKLVEDTVEIPVQINGKVRATISISVEASQDDVKNTVHQNSNIQSQIDGKTVVKEIYVKNKIYNIVVK